MRIIFQTFVLVLLLSFQANAQKGVITIESNYPVSETVDRLQDLIKEKGLTFFAKIDHTQNAQKVNMDLRPTVVLIFGNPKLGTPLMQCSQTYAIDLPQKALVYEDENGRVWIAYNDQSYLAQRHGITSCDDDVNKVKNALSELMKQAATED